jgi:cytochrome c biogenesis protein CcmG/thiol:disulfide interchange protein DsbE
MSSDVTMGSPAGPDNQSRPKRARYVIPVAIFAALAIIFAWGLTRDPKEIPSTLIGKAVPQFNLPAVKGRTAGLANTDLRGEVSLVNVFASWCPQCREEHPLIMQMKSQNVVTIHGLNYKDRPDDAAKWLDELGDPYTRTGADLNGRVGIDWGVYGVPETFVISKDARVAYKHIGPLTPKVLERTILPLIQRLRQQ